MWLRFSGSCSDSHVCFYFVECKFLILNVKKKKRFQLYGKSHDHSKTKPVFCKLCS